MARVSCTVDTGIYCYVTNIIGVLTTSEFASRAAASGEDSGETEEHHID